MRFGIMSPVVSRNPRHDPHPWEAEATIDDLVAVAQAGEQLGYELLTFPEHVAVPTEAAPIRGATYWSPLPTMGFIAAKTARIRLTTYVLVLGYHHPLELAKSYGTLDRLCGGRLVLGVGVGSLEPEFRLLGAAFDDRGDRADDALRALRASFGKPEPEYHGPYYDFEGMRIDPCGLDRHLDIWVGGRTRRSLRRAVELADGWSPFGLAPDVVAGHLTAVDHPDGFEVVLAPEPPVDPMGDADGARRQVHRYQAAGATRLIFRFRQSSRQHLLDQMSALMSLFPDAAAG